MRYRKLDADNDYSFGNSQLDFYINEPAAVAQSVLTRLLLWLGEWYLDISQGTDYMEGVLGKHSESVADITIQNRVLSTTGVVDLKNYTSTLDPNTRKLAAECTIDTVYGPTEVQIENYINF